MCGLALHLRANNQVILFGLAIQDETNLFKQDYLRIRMTGHSAGGRVRLFKGVWESVYVTVQAHAGRSVEGGRNNSWEESSLVLLVSLGSHTLRPS
ncbi:hypothetical protein O181_042702 [Austropuccinia psidii MF-1]|uniref:Uncharacterized protein n=1 Tax=Austropuccinia psidii MF-1 TaxID=1389203 RepID=A0A9Q3DJ47_9BASI|nr:hypothetical protein [Austropuccinia psidii MF-1]